MTTFQDPPPQSRRAVRRSERGEPAEPSAGPSFIAPQPAPFTDQSPRDMWDTTERRVAQLPASQPRPDGQQTAPGRRSASVTPEPLNYSTQQRPQVPTYDGPFRNTPQPAPAAAQHDALPPTQALPAAEQPSYRVRDYSPESRRAVAAWDAATNPAPAAPPSDLQYHTEARRLMAVPPLPPEVTPAPLSAVPPYQPAPAQPAVEPSAPESTLSRRELRAMLMAEAANEAAAAAASSPLVEPAPWASSSTPAPALSEAAQPSSGQLVEPAPWPRSETTSDQPQAWPFSIGEAAPSTQRQPAQPERQQPELPQRTSLPQTEDGARSLFGDLMTPISAPLSVSPDGPQAASPLPPMAPQPLSNTGLTSAMSEFDALTFAAEPGGAVEPVAPAPVEPAASNSSTISAWSPPIGHWSTQADLDDETQPYESTINRRIGSGSATTNALVLPTPDRDIRGALTGTGEVMLTGSIDLPTSLSSTGAHDRVEHESLDMLFDANDHEIVATDSAPVRAIRAVSTHNTGHGVTHTQKPKGNKGLTVLLFAACAAAIVGLGMLVTVLVLNVF
jgi:hypothetical protein